MKAANSRRSWRHATAETNPQSEARRCDHPGCDQTAEHRAPRSRDQLDEYYWFCLDHVRAYNSSWDYYAGMPPEAIEAELRRDSTWQRPTWPLGRQGANRRFSFVLDDPFDLFEEAEAEAQTRKARAAATPEDEAMKVLELLPPLTAEGLKARYKALVKRHHPDANGGDKDAEERFKQINQAYHILKTSLDA
ncbi:J domain-containing protein [Magnetospirillum fulvum]|uniref:DnaJ-class molecular chaperone n=1 Tax=Magnetospirillum fulvum MGU-K5 TaxID=1316936 RepID=S9S774_MAGFU|nr:J domain-containing protein [Magnetospirillum fulvum]EPY00504.1 DnaJ-class molecular chaperone [Magnetospirillum fulvum MGU-K5]